MDRTILLTAGGGAGTVEIIKSLKGKFRTVCLDMDENAAGLHLADKGYTVPACTDETYMPRLKEIVEKENVEIMIPLIDEEIIPMIDAFADNDSVKVLCPNREFVEICRDKELLATRLTEKGFKAPKTISAEELTDEVFPAIIKPKNSRGSRGFAVLRNKNDLEAYMAETHLHEDDLTIQELLDGIEFTVSVVTTRDNQVLSVVPKEIVIKEGITKIGVTRDIPEIIDVCKRIPEGIEANGPFNAQLFYHPERKDVSIFEINPRYSTTVALTIAAGVNEVEILIKDALGIPFDTPQGFKKDLKMIRYTSQFYIDE